MSTATKPLLIRALRSSDAGQVAELIPQLTKNIVEPEKLVSRIKSLAAIGNSLGSGNYQYCIVVKGKLVVAFAGLVCYPIPSKGLVGWIEEVVVDRNHTGQGIAQALISHLLKLAEELRLTQVKLTTADSVAAHVYGKYGFVKKGEDLLVRKYY